MKEQTYLETCEEWNSWPSLLIFHSAPYKFTSPHLNPRFLITCLRWFLRSFTTPPPPALKKGWRGGCKPWANHYYLKILQVKRLLTKYCNCPHVFFVLCFYYLRLYVLSIQGLLILVKDLLLQSFLKVTIP